MPCEILGASVAGSKPTANCTRWRSPWGTDSRVDSCSSREVFRR